MHLVLTMRLPRPEAVCLITSLLAMAANVAFVLEANFLLLIILMEKRQRSQQALATLLLSSGAGVTRLNLGDARRDRRQARRMWKIPERVESWWKNVSRPGDSHGEFLKNFRMRKAMFLELLSEIKPFIPPHCVSFCADMLQADKKLAMTFYYPKNQASNRIMCNSVGVSVPTLLVGLRQVCGAVAKHLGRLIILLDFRALGMNCSV